MKITKIVPTTIYISNDGEYCDINCENFIYQDKLCRRYNEYPHPTTSYNSTNSDYYIYKRVRVCIKEFGMGE